MSKPFNRIITVMFENQYRNYVIQNPFLKKLASAGADMTNYFGAFHPSQTNYLASQAAEICNVTNDTPPASPLMQDTLANLLEAKNVSWKAYMEAYPGDPWKESWTNSKYPQQDQPLIEYPPEGAKTLTRYYRKHNAFASFHSIQKDKTLWNKIVSDIEFWQDVANKTLPEYCWFTPDIWNDGHYLYNTHIDTDPRTQLVPQLSAWLEHVFLGDIETSKIQGGEAMGLDNIGLNLDVDLLLTDPKTAWKQSNVPKGTLIVVTFDEADYDAKGYDTNYDGPNQVYTVLLGDMIKPGTVISTPYNHYNLIKTVEENFQLGSLNKNDYGANWFRFLWREKFTWNSPQDTSFDNGNALAVTQNQNGNHLVFTGQKGELYESFLSGSGWSPPESIGLTTEGALALSHIDGRDVLIFEVANGELIFASYDVRSQNWDEPRSLNIATSGSFALTTFYNIETSSSHLMLCWVDSQGFIQSMLGDSNGFTNSVIPVNQLTDGPMSLGQVGASLYLVYKERNTRKMRMTSYNLATFNQIKAVTFDGKPAKENDTSINQWSVTDYMVGHFSKKMGALANEYQSLGNMTMGTISGEMHLIHRGGYSDLSNTYSEFFGLTGIYSASNQLSNGFGTLNQAGWTKEEEMTEVNIGVENPISVCSDGEKLTLVWADSVSNTIKYMQGSYQ